MFEKAHDIYNNRGFTYSDMYHKIKTTLAAIHYEQLTSPQSRYFSTRFYSSPRLRFKSRSEGKTGKCSKKNEADC